MAVPSPKTYAEFIRAFPDFPSAINDAIHCLAEQAYTLGPQLEEPGQAVAALTGGMAEDLQDVLLLCSRERANSALKLMRSPYEKFLYASHINSHPETAKDFVLFDSLQSKALLSALEQNCNYKMRDTTRDKLATGSQIASERFKRSKCPACGDSGPRLWTKVTPEQMAKVAGTERMHVFTYRLSTLMIHPSVRGLASQGDRFATPGLVLGFVFELMMKTLMMQWVFFNKSQTATGRVVEVLQRMSNMSNGPLAD